MEALLKAVVRVVLPFRVGRRADPTVEPQDAAHAPPPTAPPLANWVLLPILLCALVVGYAVARVAWPHLERPTAYADILVGLTTHDGLDKMRDFRAIGVFLAAAVGSAVLLRAVGRGLARHRGNDIWEGFGAMLLVALLPGLYRIGLAVTGGAQLLGPMAETGAGLVAILAVCGGLWRWRRDLTGEQFREIVGGSLGALVIGTLAAAGLLMAWYRLSPTPAALDVEQGRAFLYRGLLAAAAGVVLIFLTARTPAAVARRLCMWVLCLQVALPLLFTAVVPAPLVWDTGVTRGNFRTALVIVLAVVIGLCLVSLVRRFRGLWTNGGWSLRSALSPWCLAAVPLLFVTNLPAPPQVLNDDLHYGEWIVPGQQLRDFGKLPYRDFTPVFGSALVVSATDRAFLSRTLETWAQAEAMVYGVGACLLFLAVWWHAGPWAACFVGVLAETVNPGRMILWLPALLAFAHPHLLARPWWWLLAWVGLAPVLMFFNPTYGGSAVLATAPVAAVMAWRLLRDNPRALLRLTVGICAVGAVLAVIPAVRAVVTGYVRFVAGQAATNDIAWGIPWEYSIGRPGSHGLFATAAGYFLWELIRSAWLLMVVVLACCVWIEFRKPRAERDTGRLVFAATTCAAVLVLSRYLAGRVDPSGIWRSGPVSFLLVEVWLVVELLRSRGRAAAVPALALLAVFCGVVRLLPARTEPTLASVADQAAGSRSVRTADLARLGLVRLDGTALGCPRLGHVYTYPQHAEWIRAFRKEVDAILRPGEPFLNMTWNNAWYFYASRPVAGPYTSTQYAAGVEDQLRLVREFRADPPPLVLLRPGGDIDLSPAPLRCYRVFRELALRQLPVRRPPFLFLIDPARARPTDPTDHASRVAILDEAYPDPNLHRLPEVWGQSWKRLRKRFEVAARIDDRRVVDGPWSLPADGWHVPASHGPGVSFDLAGLNLRGADADFLAIEFEWEPTPSPPPPPGATPVPPEAALRVDFLAGDRPGEWRLVARCQTRQNGVLLMPLGSRPTWLLAPRLDRVRITVENGEKCGRFRVGGATLVRLADGK